MNQYVLPIIWSFYTYLIGKAFPFLLFMAILVLFWIGGFDFPRAPITAYVVLFDVVSVVSICILMIQTVAYLKCDDFDGYKRDLISNILVVVTMILAIATILILAAFKQI